MDPNAMAALAGGAGALGMLLLVLLLLVGFAWPLLRAVIRFAGNFQTVSLNRGSDGTIRFTGAVDDWREAAKPGKPWPGESVDPPDEAYDNFVNGKP